MPAKKKTTSILDKIQPVSELETNLVMLIYGRSGSGKTAFGATFPKPILFIDTNERGTETIKQEEDVDVVRVTEWSQMDELYWALVNGETDIQYESIVVDQAQPPHNNPGEHDCYEEAEPDEPMFVLLARDREAPKIVRHWAAFYLMKHTKGKSFKELPPRVIKKYREAHHCADAMERWHKENRDAR